MPRKVALTVGLVIHDATSARCARRALASIAKARKTLPLHVILVDNASGHGRSLVRNLPWARLIECSANKGYGAAHNRAMRSAGRGPYLVMNPDITLRPGALTTLLAFFREHPRSRILGCKLLNADGSTQASCRRFPTIGDALSGNIPLLGNRARYEMREYDHATPRRVDWVSGAFMLLRKPYRFDERFFLYFEDVDLCRRVGGVYYVPSAVAVHAAQYSSRKSLAWRIVHAASMIRYVLKHGLRAPRTD